MTATNVQTQKVAGLFAMTFGTQQGLRADRKDSFASMLENSKATVGESDGAKVRQEKAAQPGTEKSAAEKPVQETGAGEKLFGTGKTDGGRKPVEKPELSDTELAERVAAFVAEASMLLQELLGVSETQLKELLSELGMTSAGLLTTEGKKNLFLLAQADSDEIVLLTDETKLAQYVDFTEAMDELAEKFGISEEMLTSLPEDSLPTLTEAVAALHQEEQPEPEAADEAVQAEPKERKTETQTLTMEFRTETQTEQEETLDTGSRPEETFFPEQPAEQFLVQLQKAAAQVDELSGTRSLSTEIREIANQILDKVRVVVAPDVTTLEIQLTPEHLGKVHLTVTEQDGKMTARFLTENELSREAIERNLVQFKEMLQEQGLKVDTIEVTVSEFGFGQEAQTGQSQQEEQKKGRHRMLGADENEIGSGIDSLARHFMEDGESTVNYMA